MDPVDKKPKVKKTYYPKTSQANDSESKPSPITAKKKKYQEKETSNQEPPVKAQSPLTNKLIQKQEQKKKQLKITTEPLLLKVKDKIGQLSAKKLKERFMQCFGAADKVILVYEEGRPRIFFQYCQGNKQKIKEINEIIKINSQLRKEKKLVMQCYDDLFQRVQQKFLFIGYFGIKVAQKNKIKFRTKIFNKKSSKQLSEEYTLYFEKKLQKINFIMFDSQLNSVEFNTQNIIADRKQSIQNYQLYREFEKNIIKNEQKFVNQYVGQQEGDSDQQERQQKILKRKDMKIEEMKEKIKRIIMREIEPFQEQIDSKNQEVLKLNKNDDKESKMKSESLSDQVMEEQASLDNFIQTRDQIKNRIQDLSEENKFEVVKACLKRMILAEKQLISRLPIISRKREIFEKLNKNNLLILEGETGSGKSTQLPQLLCEYYKVFEKEDALPVLITQPRKLATRTLAERVASEMEEAVHGFVDYQTSLTSKVNEKAKIVFKIDRLVLDELKVDPKLSKYCCLVIDEAHERTISIDVILGLIKNLLTLRKDFKIIVTSASMDTELFRRYFKTEILKVSGRMYPVQEIFQSYEHEKDKTKKIIKLIDQKLLEQDGTNLRQQYKGHILVFCSGIDQIQELCKQYRKLDQNRFKVLALHGKLTSEEQRDVFMDTKEHKIIFSTRIAQTSITIDKVRVVVDPGQDRQLVYDQKNKITRFQLTNISISSANQRAGRAGRTNSGFCFRLYSQDDKKKFSLNKKPQIQNMALDTVVLRLKSLEVEDVVGFPYISPPEKQNIIYSVQLMKLLGCLDEEGKITEIGQFLVKIPIEPFLARAIIEAMIFEKVVKSTKFFNEAREKQFNYQLLLQLKKKSILDEVIIVLCMVLNASNLFIIGIKQRQKLDKLKFEKFNEASGDFFFFINIYEQYEKKSQNRQNWQKLRQWAKNNYLSLKTLSQTRELLKEIKQITRIFEINQEALQKQIQYATRKLLAVKSWKEAVFSCLLTSFINNLALYSGNEMIGYTIISLQIPIKIYGSSILSTQGINPKWIIFFDIYQSLKGELFCKVAQPVQFDFLLNNTDPSILKRTNIADADKLNPFYFKYERKCSSLILMGVMADYEVRFSEDRPDLNFLQNATMIFHEDTGIIESYFLRKKNLKKQKQQKNRIIKEEQEEQNIVPSLIAYYLIIEQRYTNVLFYNYIGYYYLQLIDGFQIERLENRSIQYCFKIYCQDTEIEQILSFGMHNFYKIVHHGVQITVEEKKLKGFRQLLTRFKDIQFVESKTNRADKLPEAKIFAYFWTGEKVESKLNKKKRNGDNLFLTYYYSKQSQNNQNVALLKDINSCYNSENLNVLGYDNKLIFCNFKISRNNNGINVFFDNKDQIMDQIQFFQIISDYHKKGLFGDQFIMPKRIRRFREPQMISSSKTQKQWQKVITQMLIKFGFEESTFKVRCWGLNFYQKKQSTSTYEENIKVQWHAQIKSSNLQLLKKFRNSFDKKKGILGNEKAHFKFEYQTTIAKVDGRAFRWLQSQYDNLVKELNNANPQVIIEKQKKQFRNFTDVLVKMRSQFRDQLLEASPQLMELLIPKQIFLGHIKFSFLYDNRGNKILEEVQDKMKQKVFFGFNKKQSKLKIYCKDEDLKQILQILNQKINQYKLHERQVSFRGRNLKSVREKIEEKKKEIANQGNSNRSLKYQILFQKKCIQLIGDINSCKQMENEITRIGSQVGNKCELCSNFIEKPYFLFNCAHRFCWNCLSNYIKQQRANQLLQPLPLQCPECKTPINMYDIQRIISQDQFNKLCDLRVTHYLKKHSRFMRCLTENCQNILQVQKVSKVGNFQCDICGKWHCLVCGKSHKNFTCEEKKKQDQEKRKAERAKILCRKCKQNVGEKCANCKQCFCTSCREVDGRLCMCYRYFDDTMLSTKDDENQSK